MNLRSRQCSLADHTPKIPECIFTVQSILVRFCEVDRGDDPISEGLTDRFVLGADVQFFVVVADMSCGQC